MAYLLWFIAGIAVGVVGVLMWYALHYDFRDDHDHEEL
jgi:heme/copper-type cytochrome/quinol oxidase subunit 2